MPASEYKLLRASILDLHHLVQARISQLSASRQQQQQSQPQGHPTNVPAPLPGLALPLHAQHREGCGSIASHRQEVRTLPCWLLMHLLVCTCVGAFMHCLDARLSNKDWAVIILPEKGLQESTCTADKGDEGGFQE